MGGGAIADLPSSLGVLSEAQVDALTDEIAGGRSQAEVLGQWSAPILAAHADRAAGGAGDGAGLTSDGLLSIGENGLLSLYPTRNKLGT